MSKQNGTVSKDEILATALASGNTITAASALCGYSRLTIYRRLQDAEFRARVSEMRSILLATATGKLLVALPTAVDTLSGLLPPPEKDDKAAVPHPTRRAAASDILSHAVRYHDASDLEVRVRAIEERLAALKPTR